MSSIVKTFRERQSVNYTWKQIKVKDPDVEDFENREHATLGTSCCNSERYKTYTKGSQRCKNHKHLNFFWRMSDHLLSSIKGSSCTTMHIVVQPSVSKTKSDIPTGDEVTQGPEAHPANYETDSCDENLQDVKFVLDMSPVKANYNE